jgi:hypothetical protein
VPDELAVIQRAYDLTAWAVPAIAKFPRSHRFVLGEWMEGAILTPSSPAVAGRGVAKNPD